MTAPVQHDTQVPLASSRLAALRGNCMGAAIAALVRAIRARRAIAFTSVGLAAILAAAAAGASFAGHQSNGASLTMALATAVAMFCYLAAVFSLR